MALGYHNNNWKFLRAQRDVLGNQSFYLSSNWDITGSSTGFVTHNEGFAVLTYPLQMLKLLILLSLYIKPFLFQVYVFLTRMHYCISEYMDITIHLLF